MDIYKELGDKSIVECDIFSQTWGSTALGFGGMGGSALTTAFTTIMKTGDGIYHVFFDGCLAYEVDNPTDEFFEDKERHMMVACADAEGRY